MQFILQLGFTFTTVGAELIRNIHETILIHALILTSIIRIEVILGRRLW